MTVEDWPIAREPWAGEPGRPQPWSNVEAADRFVRLYLQAGLSLRQVAEVTGFSREWVRRQLRAEGVELRPKHHPWQRATLTYDEEGAVRFGYELRLAGDQVEREEVVTVAVGEPLWTMDLFAAPAHRGVLVELGLFDGEYGAPPISKLETADGHHLTREECVAAIAAWTSIPHTPSNTALGEVYRRVCEEGGWPPGEGELAERVSQFHRLLEVLGAGAAGDGLVVT